jgi:tRNA dimethylallyltransferase
MCISKHNDTQREKESPYNFVYFVLNNDRKILYDRIDLRVDQMFSSGLKSEVETLKNLGYTKDLVSMQGIGYKEMLDYLDGCYDLEMANYIIKRDTRHFAKRQLTWFKREKSVTWMNYQDYGNSKDTMLNAMLGILKEKQLLV